MSSRGLEILERALLLVNAVGTGAATAVLALRPAAIPAVIGVALYPEQFIICYFLAGSEAAICFLCFQGLRCGLRALRVVVFQMLIVLHTTTALLSLIGVTHGASPIIIGNIALRVVLVVLLAVALVKGPGAPLPTKLV